MNKLSALRALSFGVLAFCSAGSGALLAAETSSETSGSGATTTYFPPSNDSSAPAPQTTSALPEPDKSAAPITAPAPAAAATPADTAPATETQSPPSTAAVTPPAETPASSPAPTEAATAPASASPAQPEAQPTAPAAAAAAPETLVSPVVEAARRKLADKSLIGRDNLASDVAAAADYYSAHKEPLWVGDGKFNEKAKSVISDLKKADDWGLESSDFAIPNLASNSDADAQGAAEAQLTLSALKYARFARGGRLDPVSLSNILDMKPPVKDPKVVLRELADASHPGPFLRGLNPRHDGFEKLRQELLKARGATVEEEPTDPAEEVKLPRGKVLRLGVRDDQVALLRQRLKVPSENPDSNDLFDDALLDAVKDYQRANGLNPDGLVGNGVRNAMNGGGKSKRIDPSRNVDRLIANMERWRWLPENLGSFYVMNNIPEFTSEIWKGKERLLSQKMIVGQPAWPTPMLTANMQYVIFRPSWGMPDGIKAKELAPRLRQASNSGYNFFDQLFGGGGSSSGGARVIQAYKLQVYYNGRQVDPGSVNWNTADVSRYSFTQPPGPDNPLGMVKFRFPNKHDVYMHDTPERGLFAQGNRALSHGCMRVGEPRRTAEVILQEDKGYSPEKVGELWNGGADVTLSKPVPVYLVYFTASVDENGRLRTFGDLYGNDNRVMSALRGHPVRYNAPEAIDPTEADQPGAISDGSDSMSDAPPPVARNARNNKKTASKKNPITPATTLQDALSSIFLN